MNTKHLRLVGAAPVVEESPSPAVSTERKHELLSAVVAVLDAVAPQFGDHDVWKWACIGIREDMAEAIGLARAAASSPAQSAVHLQIAAAPAG